MRIRAIIFTAIILLAALLRLYRLGSVPASPDWDEVSLGYNAYSILTTGRDEYGTPFPLSIRSFGDYKPPLYTYCAIPFIALFGLSVFSVRLPSAIFGVLAIIGTFFLVRELFKVFDDKKNVINQSESFPAVALVSSLLLAVSPWHLQFSRTAFEANLGITLNIWGVYLFLRGLRNNYFFPLSAVCVSIALWAYHSERVFIPLLGIGLIYFFRKYLFTKNSRTWVIASTIILTITMILLGHTFIAGGLSRLQGTSWISNQTDLLKQSVRRIELDRSSGDYIGTLFDNRRFVFVKTFIDGYISHFSLKWLFLTGDNARHHAPDMGLLYIVELPFLLIGLLRIARNKEKGSKILLYWFCIAPIAAAPTTGVPHAIRTLVFLPVIQIITAIGIVHIFRYISMHGQFQYARMRQSVTALIFILIFICNWMYYFSMYYDRMDRDFSEFWQYGYKNAVEYAENNKDLYDKVVVSTKLEQPYIFFLFYSKYDPKLYLLSGGSKQDGQVEFDSYTFRPLDWQNEIKDGSILYIGSPSEISHTGKGTTIYSLNGKPAIVITDH